MFCMGHSIYRLVGFFSPSIDMPLILVKYLRRPSDHVLDEVSVSWSIYYCYVVLGGLKLPEWDVYGNSSLPLGLQLVQNPSVLKGTFSHLPKQNYVSIQGVNAFTEEKVKLCGHKSNRIQRLWQYICSLSKNQHLYSNDFSNIDILLGMYSWVQEVEFWIPV